MRMLTVDPVKRITLKEIRRHPWFRVALPPYLSSVACLKASLSVAVDPEIVQQLINVSRHSLVVVHALHTQSFPFIFLNSSGIVSTQTP